jgi:SAM-dependent methyltransferase
MEENIVISQARVIYDGCPLCSSPKLADFRNAPCTHYPLYHPALPPTMLWRVCLDCEHCFTEGYFTEEALKVVFRDSHVNQTVGINTEPDRYIWARVVDRVASHLDMDRPNCWMDVGFGNGSLLFTVAEWGIEAVGLDLRSYNVEAMQALGIEAHCADLLTLNFRGRFDVISMADVLEHFPYPGLVLDKCYELLKPDGILFISLPNADTIVWKLWDRDNVNPYWAELEHYHNFSRKRLYNYLEQKNFKPFRYQVSERYRSGMELLARKIPA